MRNVQFLVLVLTVVSLGTIASASVFNEDFESYAAGSALHGKGGWKGWDNSPGAGAPVSNAHAYSGSNSVEIGGSSDLVHEFDITGGMWEFTVMQYIPSGTTGNNYFILLNSYDDGANQDWSVQLPINLATGVMTSAYDSAVAVNILYDQWVELKCVIDLDNNIVDEYYNGELFSTHQWDDNVHGTIGAIDLYSEGASSIYYDDVTITAPAGAYNPDPTDGAVLRQTWASMSWSAGTFAGTHDVYLGENYDDVFAGTGDTFIGNQPDPYLILGIFGFAYPDGLVPGTTYYWRIDQVNDLSPDSPLKGDVWSFMIAPRTAFEPVPGDGSKFIDPENPVLNWTIGFEAKQHIVYFGDDFDTVANATGGPTSGIIGYNPGHLEFGKTYYWRVDQSDGGTTYKGDVWSFTTAKEGGGIRGDYYKGMNFENHVLTRIDSRVNFSWGSGEPDPAVGADSFSVRWTGEVEAAFTETYTFYVTADDGVRLWVDGIQLVDGWVDQSATEYSKKIDLIAGNMYRVVMEMYENGGDAVAQLRWSSPSTPKQLIPQAALAPPVKANRPSPYNLAAGTKMTPILRWSAGDYAASHEVYFGTDANAVANATTSSPEYKGTKALGDESYDPGKLAWYSTYFWRVDEVNSVNPEGPWIGNLWSFTTGDFIVIDDFEDYDTGENQIWYSWHDGLGYGSPGIDPYYAGNGTGAAVGDETTASYTEETIVHGGRRSMPLGYDNDKQGLAKYSEVELTLTAPREWTEESVTELSLWFYGDSANDAEPLYVVVSNNTGTPVVVVNDDANAAQIDTWTEWVIPLQSLADQGIDLTNVTSIAIGLGIKGNTTTPGGSGKMYFDDIRLYRPIEAVE
jgi:hypothetical protein